MLGVVDRGPRKTARRDSWDAVRGAALQTLKGNSDRVGAVAFSPESKLVASASSGLFWDCTVRLWGSATGSLLQMLECHSNWVDAVVFTLDPSASDKIITL